MIRSLISLLKGYGDKGRFTIPALKIKVPLYSTEGTRAQVVVDRPNSAALIQWRNHVAIVDHVTQAFRNLAKAVPMQTIAYIEQPGFTRIRLVCVKNQVGHIREEGGRDRLYDAEWNDAAGIKEGEYVIYTCIDRPPSDAGVIDVTLTYWNTF